MFTHLVQSLWHAAIELHVLYHIGPLTLVLGDEANLVGPHSISHQLGHKLLQTPASILWVQGDEDGEGMRYKIVERIKNNTHSQNTHTPTPIHTPHNIYTHTQYIYIYTHTQYIYSHTYTHTYTHNILTHMYTHTHTHKLTHVHPCTHTYWGRSRRPRPTLLLALCASKLDSGFSMSGNGDSTPSWSEDTVLVKKQLLHYDNSYQSNICTVICIIILQSKFRTETPPRCQPLQYCLEGKLCLFTMHYCTYIE